MLCNLLLVVASNFDRNGSQTDPYDLFAKNGSRAMKLKLTDRKIALLPHPREKREAYNDQIVPTLYLRVTPKGTRSFVSRLWVDGKWQTKTLGRFPTIGIEEARRLALEVSHQRIRNREQAETMSVKEAFDSWFDIMSSRDVSDSYLNDLKVMYRLFFSRLADKPIGSLTRHDASLLYAFIYNQDKKADSSRPANNARRAEQVIDRFAQMLKHHDIDARFTQIQKARTSPARRALNEKELVAVMKAIDFHRAIEGKSIFDMLILALFTGARKGNLINARWSQFDLEEKIWTIDSEEFKSRRVHQIHLTEPILKMLENRTRDSNLVFPSEVDPLSPWQTPKKALWRVADTANVDRKNFTFKMFRHTFASHAVAAGVPGIIVSQMLGHSSAHSGLQGGAADVTMRVYTHAMASPIREGFETLASYLERL